MKGKNNSGVMRMLIGSAGALLLLGAVLMIRNDIVYAAAPVLSSISATSTATTSAVSWTTDVPATSQVLYGTTTSYGLQSPLNVSTTTSHSVLLSGLAPSTTYFYGVQSTVTGMSSTSTPETATSSTLSFTTASAATTTATSTVPVISAVSATTTATGATITWSTDLAAGSQVRYGPTASYDSSTTPNTASTTSHTASITGLTASTTYHYQALSGSATSSDFTFTTLASPTATTTVPVISSIVATATATGATITWLTDQAASSQIAYGTTTSYGILSAFDSTLATNHSLTLSALTPSTTYHFQIHSVAPTGTATSSDRTFTTASTTATTTPSTATTTPSMTDMQNHISQLQSALSALQSKVSTLQSQVAALMAGGGQSGTSTPSAGGTSTPGATGTAMIDQNGHSVRAGSSIDFGGHYFGIEENVTITLNNQIVARTHADGGGNFSTGSLSVPSTPGTYTYSFTGATRSANATITVTQ